MSCEHCVINTKRSVERLLTQRTLTEFSAGSGCILEVELFSKDFVIGYFDSHDKTYEILNLRSDSTNNKNGNIPLRFSDIKTIKNLCCEEIYEQ